MSYTCCCIECRQDEPGPDWFRFRLFVGLACGDLGLAAVSLFNLGGLGGEW